MMGHPRISKHSAQACSLERPDSLHTAASGNKTTHSFGRARNQMSQDCMAWLCSEKLYAVCCQTSIQWHSPHPLSLPFNLLGPSELPEHLHWHPVINAARTSMPDSCEHFSDSIKAVLNDCHTGNAEERWEPHPCHPLQLCHGHLQQEKEAEPWLVWRRDCCTRASNYSQERSVVWVQEGPLREVTHCIQESQKWFPADCLTLCQSLLAEPFPGYSTLCYLWQHLHHVWWHDESLWSKHHQDHTPQVHHWQHHHRLRQTDRKVGRTLP